jgi:hypothetical protein
MRTLDDRDHAIMQKRSRSFDSMHPRKRRKGKAIRSCSIRLEPFLREHRRKESHALPQTGGVASFERLRTFDDVGLQIIEKSVVFAREATARQLLEVRVRREFTTRLIRRRKEE